MDDALIGRLLLVVLAFVMGLWFVHDMSWKNKTHRFLFRAGAVMMYMRGLLFIATNLFGLFPLD